MSKLILAIEDDQDIAELYKDILTDAGYRVELMRFKPRDLSLINQMQPDLIISDWGLEAGNRNWDFINSMQSMVGTSLIPIMICSAVSLHTNNNDTRLHERNIEVLEKPFDIEDLLKLVEKNIK